MTEKFSALPSALPHISGLSPYVPGKQPVDASWVKLNTNENPYPPSPKVQRNIESELGRLNLYPNPAAQPVRAKIAARHSLRESQVIIGNGSDDILNLLVRTFAGPGRTIGTTEPNYLLYPILAQMQNAETVIVPLRRSMELPQSQIAQCGANIFFLSSPNSPTGVAFPSLAIKTVLKSYPGLLVVDEAYAAFADGDTLALLNEHFNLCIVRTFSKSHGLAGLRIGYALASEEVIDLLDRVRDSYNVNRLSQVAALGALEDVDYYDAIIREIVTRRTAYAARFEAMDWYTFPSQANFLCTEPVNAEGFPGPEVADDLFQFLYRRKILVRHISGNPLTASFLRISIGSEQSMRSLIGAVEQWLRKE